MKSRDEIVIIMLQWMRLYTLGSRGSRELKTLLEIPLISSRIDQKLKNKEGKYMILKGKLGQNRGQLRDRGGGLMASRGRFRGHRSWLQFRNESVVSLASILLPNSHDFRHNRPRSRHDRATTGSRSWY